MGTALNLEGPYYTLRSDMSLQPGQGHGVVLTLQAGSFWDWVLDGSAV